MGSGFLLPQLGQKLPVMPLWPQEHVHPLGRLLLHLLLLAHLEEILAFMPPACPAIPMPMKAMAGPARWCRGRLVSP